MGDRFDLAMEMALTIDDLSPLTPEYCIFRVTELLRKVNEKAYTPQKVSIGPLHHGNESLSAMEEHKTRFLSDHLKRTSRTLDELIEIVWNNEARLRRCYSEPLSFSVKDLARIVVVDSVFVIEVLLRNKFKYLKENDDRIFNKPRLLQDICLDLLLLENQLPFFIIEALYDPNKIPGLSNPNKVSIPELLHHFLKNRMHLKGIDNNLDRVSGPNSNVAHFIDFLRRLYIPSAPNTPEIEHEENPNTIVSELSSEIEDEENPNTIESESSSEIEDEENPNTIMSVLEPKSTAICTPSVTELYLAGVIFKEAEESEGMFGFKFSEGVFSVPSLTISGTMEQILRNLMAFEQLHCSGKSYLNDYVVMMDKLVNTARDVDILVEEGILENWLGDSEEAAKLVNNLGDGASIDVDDFYFSEVSDQLRSMATWNRLALARKMDWEIYNLSPIHLKNCCIYRVPERFRQLKEKAYMPQKISIGPLHHGNESLSTMEEHKTLFLSDHLKRTSRTLNELIEIVWKDEPKLRSCYAERLNFSAEELVKMVVVDSVFVIEVLLRDKFKDFKEEHDQIFNKPWLIEDIRPDLFLLENQLPFFIIEALYDPNKIRSLSNTDKLSIPELLHHFLEGTMHLEGIDDNLDKVSGPNSNVAHFVDFLRTLYIPKTAVSSPQAKNPEIPNTIVSVTEHFVDFLGRLYKQCATKTAVSSPPTKNPEIEDEENLNTIVSKSEQKSTKVSTPLTPFVDFLRRLYIPKTENKETKTPSATELYLAGVKFKKAEKSEGMFGFKFSEGVFSIPSLKIVDGMDKILRNLMAFEQLHCYESYLNHYVSMMDILVDTKKDVDLLAEVRILDNWLGDSEEAAKFVNNLGDCAGYSDDFYFQHISDQLKDHTKATWNRWRANLMHNYFNTPWSIISVVAAIIVIALTFIQTVCSVVSVT